MVNEKVFLRGSKLVLGALKVELIGGVKQVIDAVLHDDWLSSQVVSQPPLNKLSLYHALPPCHQPSHAHTLTAMNTDADRLKTLKVVDLRQILTQAAIQIPTRANKADLVSKILSTPEALQVFNQLYGIQETPTEEVHTYSSLFCICPNAGTYYRF